MFLITWIFQLIVSVTITYPCEINMDTVNSILSDLESKGYGIEYGKHLYYFNSTEFAANPNGLYGVYEFDFLDVPISPFWYVPGESAIMMHICSPPESAYFSYRSYLGNDQATYDPFPIEFASMGDSINQLVINYTNNTSPFDSLITMITTADQITFNDIYNSFKKVNLQQTINLDIIPSIIGNHTLIFGKNPSKSDIFTFLARIAIPFNQSAYYKYINQTFGVYFIKRGTEIEQENQQPRVPYSFRQLRNKTSTINEFDIYLDNLLVLNQSVINYLTNNEYQNLTLYRHSQLIANDYTDGEACIEYNLECNGDNEDAAYFETFNKYNKTTKITQFLTNHKIYIVLGINHYSINQSVYNSVGLMKLDDTFPKYSQFAGITNFEGFNGSAIFFNKNLKYIQNMFVTAFAQSQNCDLLINKLKINNVPCLGFNETIIKPEDPFMFITRDYLNPWTKTGPSYQQTIPEFVLEFNV